MPFTVYPFRFGGLAESTVFISCRLVQIQIWLVVPSVAFLGRISGRSKVQGIVVAKHRSEIRFLAVDVHVFGIEHFLLIGKSRDVVRLFSESNRSLIAWCHRGKLLHLFVRCLVLTVGFQHLGIAVIDFGILFLLSSLGIPFCGFSCIEDVVVALGQLAVNVIVGFVVAD
ncbi:hypothetical protein FLJC2902T_32260 [Flavobacterium limnosediminis JC2902]|uniref:Uncharacterized protein n=1 Tax=Flavobacterium limnosediminis JC2902 TaxID=1341181 RepID=V6SA17_9FLAO|nr:hypothetical protein FLJC2902T_32260 [Flavobacterium limnosediminis JC2902]